MIYINRYIHDNRWVVCYHLYPFRSNLGAIIQMSRNHAMGRHAGCQEVGRCHTRGESEDSVEARKRASDSTLALKPRADVTRSPKQGYQRPYKKDVCPPKNLILKNVSKSYWFQIILQVHS